MEDLSTRRLLIVDGHCIYRDGLCQAFHEIKGLRVIACQSFEENLATPGLSLSADAALVDIDLPRFRGIETAQRIIVENPSLSLIFVGDRDWDILLVTTWVLRGSGFVLRATPPEKLADVIRLATVGQAYTVDQLQRIQHWKKTMGVPLRSLSGREWQVIWLIADGKTNRTIAHELSLSSNTVEKHVTSILLKINLPSRASLLSYIFCNHLDIYRHRMDILQMVFNAE